MNYRCLVPLWIALGMLASGCGFKGDLTPRVPSPSSAVVSDNTHG